MHVPIFGISTKHRGMPVIETTHWTVVKPRWKRHTMLLASERIPHDGLTPTPVDQDGKAVAAAHETPLPHGASSLWHRETIGMDAVRCVQDGIEVADYVITLVEEADEWGFPVVFAEALDELGVKIGRASCRERV